MDVSKKRIYKGQLHTYINLILLNAPLNDKAIDFSSYLKFLPQSYKEMVTFRVTAKKIISSIKKLFECVAKSNYAPLSLHTNLNLQENGKER